MPLPVFWTPLLDDTLCILRARGVSWDAIARGIGVSRNSVLTRGRQLGFGRNPLPMRKASAIPPVPKAERQKKLPRRSDRPPLPPGHPESWGVITADTLLDGAAYPRPSLDAVARGRG